MYKSIVKPGSGSKIFDAMKVKSRNEITLSIKNDFRREKSIEILANFN